MKRKNLTLNLSKQGNVAIDSITWIIIIFFFVIVGIFSLILFNNLNDGLQGDTSINQDARDKLADVNSRLPTWLDGAVLSIAVMLWLAVLIASIFIDSHPVFFIIVFIIAVFVVLLSMFLSNFYDILLEDSEVSAMALNTPITNFILSNLGWYAVALVVTIGVVLYAKNQ